MDNTISIVLIVCATLTAIVAIVFDHLSHRQCNNSTENLLSHKITKLHRNYIAGILGVAILFLLTSEYGGPNNGIFEYLSFGATITSLVLSILAIFVTVQSSSDLYKQFAKMDDATNTITSVSKKIQDTLTKISQAESELDKTSKNINEQIDKIVDEIDKRVKVNIQGTEQRLTEKFQEIGKQNDAGVPDVRQKNHPTTSSAENKWFAEWIQKYIKIMSYNGLLLLYACSLSNRKKKMFNLTELFPDNEQYVYGILISAISSGFLTADVNNDVIHCTQFYLHPYVEKIRSEINSRIAQQTENNSIFTVLLNKIETFFNTPDQTTESSSSEIVEAEEVKD